MKKILSLLLVLVLLMSVVTGCSKPNDKEGGEKPGTEVDGGKDKGDSQGAEEVGKVAKLGLGHSASIARSEDAKDDDGGIGQADVTVAAVGFDKDDKIVSITIDTAQTKVEFDKDGKLVTDKDATPKSKKELKDEYGMKGLSENIGIGKEWYEQVEALEEWMIGKTVDEITGMKFKENPAGYEDAPDVAELASSVSISVTTYLEVVKEAWDNAVEVQGGETVGLGLMTTTSGSAEAEDDKEAKAQMDSTMTATAFDKDGNVAATIIDTVQISVNFDKDGKVTSDKEVAIKTKHELKEDYGMKGVSEKIGIGKEWYEQMESLQEWMISKSVADITGMAVKTRDEDHTTVPDVAELNSSVTMNVGEYKLVVDKASKQAR